MGWFTRCGVAWRRAADAAHGTVRARARACVIVATVKNQLHEPLAVAHSAQVRLARETWVGGVEAQREKAGAETEAAMAAGKEAGMEAAKVGVVMVVVVKW